MNNLTQKVDHLLDRTTQKILVYQADNIRKSWEYKSPIAFQKKSKKSPENFKPFGEFFFSGLITRALRLPIPN